MWDLTKLVKVAKLRTTLGLWEKNQKGENFKICQVLVIFVVDFSKDTILLGL